MMIRLIFTLNIAVFLLSCSAFELQEPQKSDFFTNGSLSENVFQVVLKQKPSGKNRKESMVLQREDAFIGAKSDIKNLMSKTLYDYILSKNKNLAGEKKYYLKYFENYFKFSKIIQEYYEEDNTLVLVIRIYKKNIKTEIDNLN